MQKTRSERFDMTLTEEEKNVMTRASIIKGHASFSDFVRSTMLSISREITESYENKELVYSEKGREMFRKLFLNPPDPSSEMASLMNTDFNETRSTTANATDQQKAIHQ